MKIGSLLRRIPLKSRLASIAATRPQQDRAARVRRDRSPPPPIWRRRSPDTTTAPGSASGRHKGRSCCRRSQNLFIFQTGVGTRALFAATDSLGLTDVLLRLLDSAQSPAEPSAKKAATPVTSCWG